MKTKLFFLVPVIFFVVLHPLLKVNAQGWSNVGMGMGNSSVISLATYNGQLYAGGGFTQVESHLVRRIAKWNGTAWDSLTAGVSSPGVAALQSYNGELYVAGNFTTAGGITVNHIARWNGTAWDSLGSGTNNSIDGMEVYNGELYALGGFTFAGGIPANRIAKWNGTSWSALPGIVGIGGSAVIYNNKLCVSPDAGGGYIKTWDGSTWDSIPSPVNSALQGMTVYNGELYVCDMLLTYVGNGPLIPVNMIAKWDGSQWSDVGGGLTICCSMISEANAMIVYNGELYVGGLFQFAGGIPASNIAKWNGTTWSPVCGGANNAVRSFTVYDGELYVGGFFTSVGGLTANRVAKYSPPYAAITPDAATVCNGNFVTLNANTGDALSWQWYNNNSPITGAVASQLNVTAPGSYSVVVTFPGQCPSATSTAVPVTEGTGPTDVTITSTSTVGCLPNTIYTGYGSQSITLTANATGAVSYLWSTGETTQSISVSTAGAYSVTAYDTNGCASVQTPETETTINVVDARCGNNNTKIKLCHVPNGNVSNRQTICISPSAVPAHLALHAGDCIGSCNGGNRIDPETDMDEEIIVEPNPASNEVYITGYPKSEKTTVEIYDVLGERVFSQQPTASSQQLINVSSLPNGIYTVQVKYQDRLLTSRLVLNK